MRDKAPVELRKIVESESQFRSRNGGSYEMPNKHELSKSNIESLLLSLLCEQRMYGYQIIKELEGRSQGYFQFKEGTLYPALHRLERAGLIEGTWQRLPEGRSGQQRKYYQLTQKGADSLAQKRSSWNKFLAAMNLIIQERAEESG